MMQEHACRYGLILLYVSFEDVLYADYDLNPWLRVFPEKLVNSPIIVCILLYVMVWFFFCPSTQHIYQKLNQSNITVLHWF
jgi:hypothetical protein